MPARELQKVLVANRGEIAVRVLRTCREMGIRTVAVHSDADRAALHVRLADEAVRLGPPPPRESYLSVERLVEAARATGADAVHPGYGFLSERPELPRALAAAGIGFVGPPAEAIEAMGEKTRARAAMEAAGVPVVPGSGPLAGEEEARAAAARLGYPVMVKAAAGGGGKGMRRVAREEELAAAWAAASREATGAFGDGRLYLEKLLARPRHVEVQVFGDLHGEVIWLGERECSVQRRQQKILEESPSCAVDEALRRRMGEVAVRAARAVGYVGAGTVELLLDEGGGSWFLEMNTRLQVEHPVTELTTGLDLVRLQLEVARGGRVPPQEAIVRRGHAIEARVCAEDPARGFLPSPGTITRWSSPGGPFVREDGGVAAGSEVSPFYDPLLAKLVAWAPTRAEAIERLRRALGELSVHGVSTNAAYLRAALGHTAFRSGDYDTAFCERFHGELLRRPTAEEEALAVAVVLADLCAAGGGAAVRRTLRLDGGKRAVEATAARGADGALEVTAGGAPRRIDAAPVDGALWIVREGARVRRVELDRRAREVRVHVRGDEDVVVPVQLEGTD